MASAPRVVAVNLVAVNVVSTVWGMRPLSRIAIVIVAAVAENGVIGQEGHLPWRLKSEMQRFRTLTWGKPVVVGRKTYLSFTKQPLPGRTNIVVSRDPNFAVAGALVTSSLVNALEAARGDALRRGADAVVVLGGADIYKQTLALADRLVITQVHLRPSGDTKFPEIDPAIWSAAGQTEHQAGAGDEAGFTVVEYVRTKGGAAPA
jgi:dihydrofolate reductase